MAKKPIATPEATPVKVEAVLPAHLNEADIEHLRWLHAELIRLGINRVGQLETMIANHR